MRCTKGFLLLLCVVLLNHQARGQAQQDSIAVSESVVTGSLMELRNSRRVLLLIRRSGVIDSRGLAKTILTEVYRTDANTNARYPRLFNSLARKLNDYLKKYQSISAANDISDAEFIIFFSLLEYRRPLGVPYPYGELFVIANDTRGGKSPHIVWKSRKGATWAEDAIKDLIKDLKIVRGEG